MGTSPTADTNLRAMHGQPALKENLTTGAASVESTAAMEKAIMHSVTANQNVFWKLGAKGAAAASATNGLLLTAGQRWFFVPNDENLHIQVIQETAAGVFSIATHEDRTAL